MLPDEQILLMLMTPPAEAAPGTGMHLWVNGVELDFTTDIIGDLEITFGESHPGVAAWTMRAPNHTLPITYNDFVVITDDVYGGWSTPVFEGWVREMNPTEESNTIQYTAYDATLRASNEVFVLSDSAIWSTTIPRRVYNVNVDTDEDRAFEFRHEATVGQILQDLLEFAYAELVLLNAAPPLAIGTPAYEPGDFTALAQIPQEKIVFEGVKLRDAIDRMLSYYPQYRLRFLPGVATTLRKWRLYDAKASPEITLTLNRYNPTDKWVLSMELKRSFENRYTAIQIDGPEVTQNAQAIVSDGTLTEQWTAFAESTFRQTGPGLGTENVSRKWQIADVARRRIAHLLPSPVLVPIMGGFGSIGNLAFQQTRDPSLIVTFDGNTWILVQGCHFDFREGIVTAPWHVYTKDDGQAQPFILPVDVRLYYAFYDAPLTVRYPATGFEGTAYDDFGVAIVDRRYDESLAVGWDNNVPVTSAARQAQFLDMATQIHAAYSDSVVAGGCVIQGIDYDFLRLDRRVNIAGVDDNGDPLVTGWEAAGCILSDVKYSYPAKTTTLTFNSDHLEYTQVDPGVLAERLGIEATRPRVLPAWDIVVTGNLGFTGGLGNLFRFSPSSLFFRGFAQGQSPSSQTLVPAGDVGEGMRLPTAEELAAIQEGG